MTILATGSGTPERALQLGGGNAHTHTYVHTCCVCAFVTCVFYLLSLCLYGVQEKEGKKIFCKLVLG